MKKAKPFLIAKKNGMKQRFAKYITILGIAATIIGSLLPWQCSGDILWHCYPGISLNPTFLYHPGILNFFFTPLLILCSLDILLIWLQRAKGWRGDLLFLINASLGIGLCLFNKLLLDNGGALVVFLSLIFLWFKTRHADNKNRIIPIIRLTTSFFIFLLSISHILSILARQIAEKDQVGGVLAFL